MREEGKDGLPSQFGRYTLVERLAMGGMAEVFKAKILSSHGFEKMLVIKRILPHLAADRTFVSMFIDEAKVTAQLTHPKIVQVIDFGDVAGQYFIAMEFIDGFDALALLRAAASKHVRLPLPIAMFVTMEILDALDYAHNAHDTEGREMRIVHRDISPSNVFIARRGDVKLGDFGIAHAQERESKTQAGTLKGKYGYMSPEQVVGAALDARSDLFAVGIVLAEMVMGRRLFTAPNDLDVLLMVRDGRLERLEKYGRDLPAALDQILRKALAKRVADRFQSAADFRDALGEQLFAWGFRVSAQDLGKISADYLDPSEESNGRLTDLVKRWDLRGPITGVNNPPSGVVGRSVTPATDLGSGSVKGMGSGPVRTAQAYPPPPPASQVVISPDVLEIQARGAVKQDPAQQGFDEAETNEEPAPDDDPLNLVIDEEIDEPPGRSKASAPPAGPAAQAPAIAPVIIAFDDPTPPPTALPLRPPGRSAKEVEHDFQVTAALTNISSAQLVSLDDYAASPSQVAHSPLLTPHAAGLQARSASAAILARIEPLANQATGQFVPTPISRSPDKAADLSNTTPLRIFADLAMTGETGLLRFELSPHMKEVYLVRGAPESVASSLRNERFGEYLVARGVLSPADLDRALTALPRNAGKLGDTLVAMGLMKPLDVFRLLSQQVRERVMDIFSWVQGRAAFYREVRNPNEAFPLGLDPFEILGAGVLTLAAENIERRLGPVVDRRPTALAPGRLIPEAFRLGPTPREVWGRFDGARTLREWLSQYQTADERLTFMRTTFLLAETGLVEFR